MIGRIDRLLAETEHLPRPRRARAIAKGLEETMAQTSDRVSSIAARYVGMTAARLIGLTATDASAERAAEEIRAMAASLMRQDETRGLRGLVRKVLGR